jgi:hypothetical protein
MEASDWRFSVVGSSCDMPSMVRKYLGYPLTYRCLQSFSIEIALSADSFISFKYKSPHLGIAGRIVTVGGHTWNF